MLKRDTRTCPYCDSEEIEYLGLEDGGGDFGDSVTETYKCLECNAHLERSDFDFVDEDDDQ